MSSWPGPESTADTRIAKTGSGKGSCGNDKGNDMRESHKLPALFTRPSRPYGISIAAAFWRAHLPCFCFCFCSWDLISENCASKRHHKLARNDRQSLESVSWHLGFMFTIDVEATVQPYHQTSKTSLIPSQEPHLESLRQSADFADKSPNSILRFPIDLAKFRARVNPIPWMMKEI